MTAQSNQDFPSKFFFPYQIFMHYTENRLFELYSPVKQAFMKTCYMEHGVLDVGAKKQKLKQALSPRTLQFTGEIMHICCM